MIVPYNPSESKYFTFKYRKNASSLWEYYRIEVVKLVNDEAINNIELDLEKLGIDEDTLLKQSERYAYFSSKNTLHYKMPKNFIAEEIILEGFNYIPTYFYKAGGGFTYSICIKSFSKGIRTFLGDNEATINNFIISKTQKSSFRKLRDKNYKVVLNWDDFSKLFHLSVSSKVQGEKMAIGAVSEFFQLHFAKYSRYKPMDDSSIMKRIFLSSLNDNLIRKFNKDEMEQIQSFYEKLINRNVKRKNFMQRNMLVIKEINLESIIKEFELHLKKKTLESTWQKFFEKNIFIFDSRYIEFIPKFNLKC